ncbi:hypothetical protein [Aquimarina agarivorans]|uniref:hypothetical protein n=1 Tax=Aquimarina agarivorans TaxID=980584 RepID=UPI000248EFE9|nr:hypothetical protein [Aquimarina agarivorans]
MIDFLKDKKCCEEGTSNNDPETKDCLDIWNEKLIRVTATCNTKSAITAKDNEAYQNSTFWLSKLKNWQLIIDETDKKAESIVNELKFFLDQTIIVSNHSEIATREIKKLFGLVKSIFDTFYTYENSKPGLKAQITDFKELIKLLKNTSEEDKAEVITCIEDYEKKIILVCEMQDEVLIKMFEIFKYANILSKSLCGEGGLEDKIEGLQEIFTSDSNDGEPIYTEASLSKENDHTKKKSARKMVITENSTNYAYPCDDTLKSMPSFPIKQSAYYQSIESGLVTANNKTLELEETWKESKEKSDRCLSEKAGLIDAITAAEIAEKA